MSIIRPFHGLRPTVEFAKDVAAPPYDVLSSDEARQLVKSNPNSFLRVNKSEVDFSQEESIYNKAVYQKGKENLSRLINEKIMIREEQPSFYLYRLTMNGKSQTGLAALTSVEEYNQGLIKKHEHTRPEKVNDRADHIMTLEAQVGPVFSIFRSNPSIKTLFNKLTSSPAEIDFIADDKIRHELWILSNKNDVENIVNQFSALSELYIADGHHRSQAASEVCRRMKEANPEHTGEELYNYFLNVIFPDDELYIMAYNRVVSETGSLNINDIIRKSADKFEIERSDTPIVPSDNHNIGVYMDNQWYKFVIKKDSYDTKNPAEIIDSAILTKNLLAPILGIENLRTDNRIAFVGGIRGVEELIKLVDSNQYKIAFSMYPVTVAQLLAVADAGKVMPPKSTWFEPKLRSGMVVNLLYE